MIQTASRVMDVNEGRFVKENMGMIPQATRVSELMAYIEPRNSNNRRVFLAEIIGDPVL